MKPNKPQNVVNHRHYFPRNVWCNLYPEEENLRVDACKRQNGFWCVWDVKEDKIVIDNVGRQKAYETARRLAESKRYAFENVSFYPGDNAANWKYQIDAYKISNGTWTVVIVTTGQTVKENLTREQAISLAKETANMYI